MPHKVINPEGKPNYSDKYGVSRGVVAGDMLFMSGQVPLTEGNRRAAADTFEGQTMIVFERLTDVLGRAGFSWDDVVKLNVYVNTDEPDAVPIFHRLLKEHLKTGTEHEKAAVAETWMTNCIPFQGEDYDPDAPPVMIEVEGIAVRQGGLLSV